MALPTAEWLHHAQRLAVGQSARVRHRTETTAALTVKNLPDRWTAWCHRCNQGGVQIKTHAVLGRIPDQKAFMPWPDDAKPLTEWPLYEQETLFKLLLTKGVDLQVHLAGVPIWYSRKQGRLLLGSRLGWLGRATRNQLPKWAGYGYPAPAYAAAPGPIVRAEAVVVTEDYLSALKVRWALRDKPGITAHAALGTTLRDKHLADLLEHGCTGLWLMLDGDLGGDKGVERIARRARGMGLPVRVLQCPRGYDPKDLDRAALRSICEEIYGSSAVTGAT